MVIDGLHICLGIDLPNDIVKVIELLHDGCLDELWVEYFTSVLVDIPRLEILRDLFDGQGASGSLLDLGAVDLIVVNPGDVACRVRNSLDDCAPLLLKATPPVVGLVRVPDALEDSANER